MSTNTRTSAKVLLRRLAPVVLSAAKDDNPWAAVSGTEERRASRVRVGQHRRRGDDGCRWRVAPQPYRHDRELAAAHHDVAQLDGTNGPALTDLHADGARARRDPHPYDRDLLREQMPR